MFPWPFYKFSDFFRCPGCWVATLDMSRVVISSTKNPLTGNQLIRNCDLTTRRDLCTLLRPAPTLSAVAWKLTPSAWACGWRTGEAQPSASTGERETQGFVHKWTSQQNKRNNKLLVVVTNLYNKLNNLDLMKHLKYK